MCNAVGIPEHDDGHARTGVGEQKDTDAERDEIADVAEASDDGLHQAASEHRQHRNTGDPVDVGKPAPQQPVFGHRQRYPHETERRADERGGESAQRADDDNIPGPGEASVGDGRRQRSAGVEEPARDEESHASCRTDVQSRNYQHGQQCGDRDVSLRTVTLLDGARDQLESGKRPEARRGAGQHPGPAERHETTASSVRSDSSPVGDVTKRDAADGHEEQHQNVDRDEDGRESRVTFDSESDDGCENDDYCNGEEVRIAEQQTTHAHISCDRSK